MKRLMCFLLVLASAASFAVAQTTVNLTRNVLVTIDANEIVKPGEFQMELLKGSLFDEKNETPWFSYIYTTVNRFTNNSNIYANDRPKVFNRSVNVRTYKIASRLENCIFVVKNIGAAESDMGVGMELVYANGLIHPVCDSILDINDDGYVFSSQGECYYAPFLDRAVDNLRAVPIVWPERKVYDPKQSARSAEEAFARLQYGDVYYESVDGHYYYVYRDKYMPFSVLMVDNKAFELFDVYDEDSFRFKFSYDGRHWMAVGKEYYWVDGVMKSIAGHAILDFAINNEGHYGYTAQKLDGSGSGCFVVADGKIIRRNAKVCYFGLNADGKLKFRFVTGGRCLQYEDDNVTDETDNLSSVYYPDNRLNNETVTVLSKDGAHKLTYKEGIPAVMVDNVKVTESIPCYAVFDERNSAFVWNAVEERNGRRELVIYKYKVKTGLFKGLF